MHREFLAQPNSVIWEIRRMDKDGCYPADLIKNPVNYWINYIMHEKNKALLEELSDKG